MLDLQPMQDAYLKQLAQLRAKYHVPADGSSVGLPNAVQYQGEVDALYGNEYQRRIDALTADETQRMGEPPDESVKLYLIDVARQSFGMTSNFSAPIETDSTLEELPYAVAEVVANAVDGDPKAQTIPDYLAGVLFGPPGPDQDKKKQQLITALEIFGAAVLVYFVVRNT